MLGGCFPFGNYITTIPWQKEGRKERKKEEQHPLKITLLLSRGKRKEEKKERRTTPFGNYITTIAWQKEGKKEEQGENDKE
jgi:hypothetical protein